MYLSYRYLLFLFTFIIVFFRLGHLASISIASKDSHNVIYTDWLPSSVGTISGDYKTKNTNGLFDGGPCLVCLVLVKYQQTEIQNGTQAKQLLSWARRTCIMFGIESPLVCSGGIDLFGQQVMEIISQVKIPPKELCSRLFPDKCAYYQDSLIVPEWNVKLPPYHNTSKSKIVPKTFSGSKILQISDLHIDMKYRPGSDAECAEPLCCRTPISLRRDKILKYIPHTWSSTAKNYMNKIMTKKVYSNRGAGRWGDYRNCDLPRWTFEHMLRTVSGKVSVLHENKTNVVLYPKYEYVMWSGDGVAHDVWNSTKDQVVTVSRYISNSIKQYFPHTSVVPVIGNHDSFPSNNFPPSDVLAKNYSVGWLYEEFANQWKEWLDEDALKTLKLGGFFTVLLPSGLRVVSLNTNFCYNLNWWILLEKHDPQGMLQWFVEVLRKAEAKGEPVHVLGHIPPGRRPDCTLPWTKQYYRIIERFQATIAGQFFGHTHFDEFQLFYDSKENPMSVGYLGPSVTPFSDTNPAFRFYNLDDKGSVFDHTTYYFDLREENLLSSQSYNKTEAKWKFEYTAKSIYKLASLSPNDLHNLITYWRKEYFGNNRVPQSLQLYAKYYSKSKWDGVFRKETLVTVDEDKPCTNEECIRKILCDIPKNVKWAECKI